MSQENVIQRLQDEFERLPGIGPKSAQRIVYWLLNGEAEDAKRLASTIVEVKESVHFCSRCFNYAADELCGICKSAEVGDRDHSIICVVSEPRDIAAIEKTHEYHGTYHVLGGEISPMDGVGPDDLTIRDLLTRLAGTGEHEVREVLLATNPNVEGETTAVYLSRLIKPLGIKTTRLASGLPVGGDLEFADTLSLGRAIEARLEI
ncbi:MAG: recombination mediator RecR [Coriobacteriales bacterium]|jgi:recombination protein RecR|nr:recombination mediator RecR [Coriobacteriales bacterium]